MNNSNEVSNFKNKINNQIKNKKKSSPFQNKTYLSDTKKNPFKNVTSLNKIIKIDNNNIMNERDIILNNNNTIYLNNKSNDKYNYSEKVNESDIYNF